MNDYEDLFNEAENELKKEAVPDDWGEQRTTTEGDRILTRYLGDGLLPPYDTAVFRFVEYPGEPQPFYLRSVTRLARAIEEAAPNIGDVVALVRGQDKDVGKDNPMQTWAARARPCDEPLPTASRDADSDIPF